MAQQLASVKKATALSFALFLIGLALISYFNYWWPGIMAALGIALAARHYLLGKYYDTAITLFVFLGVFITVFFHLPDQFILPVLFVIGGIYFFFRNFLDTTTSPEDEREKNLNKEIEEEQKK